MNALYSGNVAPTRQILEGSVTEHHDGGAEILMRSSARVIGDNARRLKKVVRK